MKQKIKIILLCCVLCLLLWFVTTVSMASHANPNQPLYFDRKPFINPRIIEDLTTWISDVNDQIVAIDLFGSQESNRYFGETKTRKVKGKNPFVYFKKDEESFGYLLVGKTDSGVYVLDTGSYGGGSAIFTNLLFVTIEKDSCLSYQKEKQLISLNKERLIIKKLGHFGLGDRYNGDLSVKGNTLFIGKDKNHFKNIKKDTVIKIDIK